MCYVGFIFQCLCSAQLLSFYVSATMAKDKYREEIRTANDYMRFKNLNHDLRDRVREYYKLNHDRGQAFDEHAILAKLSGPLRDEIMQFNARELLAITPMLKNTPSAVFREMSHNFESTVHSANEPVITE